MHFVKDLATGACLRVRDPENDVISISHWGLLPKPAQPITIAIKGYDDAELIELVRKFPAASQPAPDDKSKFEPGEKVRHEHLADAEFEVDTVYWKMFDREMISLKGWYGLYDVALFSKIEKTPEPKKEEPAPAGVAEKLPIKVCGSKSGAKIGDKVSFKCRGDESSEMTIGEIHTSETSKTKTFRYALQRGGIFYGMCNGSLLWVIK